MFLARVISNVFIRLWAEFGIFISSESHGTYICGVQGAHSQGNHLYGTECLYRGISIDLT